MTILHYNIRSLRVKFDELCIIVDKFNGRRNIVAMVLSETWYIDDISYFNIDGFIVHYNGASFNKCDRAVMYIKDGLTSKIKNIHLSQVSMLERNIELDNYNLNINT
nr:unnamed protein product [Callosobruchus analis]